MYSVRCRLRNGSPIFSQQVKSHREKETGARGSDMKRWEKMESREKAQEGGECTATH